MLTQKKKKTKYRFRYNEIYLSMCNSRFLCKFAV